MEKHIYIFKTENGSCKIGVSKNIEQRKTTISYLGNSKIIDIFYTQKCSNAYEIEGKMHKYFEQYRVIGEWFDIDFNMACMKLKKMFDSYAITTNEEKCIKLCDYHADKKALFKPMDITLSNTIIDNVEFDDVEICIYIALMKILLPMRSTQFVSYNMIIYELFGGNCKRAAQERIKSGLDKFIQKGLVTVVNKISSTEFELDMHKLLFDFHEDNEYYTVLKSDEIHKIMNIDNKMDKFKVLRYFTICIRTLCHSKGMSCKQKFVGFMPQEYLCDCMGISYKDNSKLIQQYNAVLEENHLLYIYRHKEMKRNTVTGQFKSFTNHYGRYEDREDIITFAKNCEKDFA